MAKRQVNGAGHKVRISTVLLLLAAALVFTSSASAALRGQITEARADRKTKQLKVKASVECFRTPGEPLPGFGGFTDGCGPGEEGWPRITLLLHNTSVKQCKPGSYDRAIYRSANTQELKEKQPENVETISFSFTRKIRILSRGAFYVCLEYPEIAQVPISGCSEPCFVNEVLAVKKVKWYGHKPAQASSDH